MAELNTQQRAESVTRVAIGAKERSGASAQEADHRKRVAHRLREEAGHVGPRDIMARARELNIDIDAAQENIDQNIGTIDPKTGKSVRTTKGEKARYKQVLNAERVAHNVIQKDFVDLSPTEITALRNSAKEALESMPEAKQLLAEFAGDPLGLDHFIMGSLSQLNEEGDLKGAIAKQYKEVFSRAHSASQETLDVQVKVDAAKAKVDTIQESIEANNAAIDMANKKLDEFAIGVPPGAKALELTAEEAKVSAFLASVGKTDADIAKMRAAKSSNELKLQNLKNKYTAFEGRPVSSRGPYDANAKNKDLNDIQSEIDKVTNILEEDELILPQYDVVVARKNALTEEAANLQSEKDRHAQEGRRLTSEKVVAEGELNTLITELDAAKLKDTGAYIKDAQGIMTDALRKLYEQRLQAAVGLEDQVLQEMIDHEVNPHVKKALQEIQDGRWRQIVDAKNSKLKIPFIGNKIHGGRSLGHGEVERFDTKRIAEDIARIKAYGEKAPEMIVDDMLTEMGYKPAQRKELLASEEFKTKVIPKATERLLASALQADAISRKDSEAIQIAIGSEKMQQAMDSHKEWLEEQKKEIGFIGTSADFIKKHPKFGWWLALSIFYPPAGLLVGGGFALKGLFTNSNAHGGHEADHAGAAHAEKTKKKKKLEELVAPPVGMGGPGSLTPAGSHS